MDPITDENYLSAHRMVSGYNHNIQLELKCDSKGIPSLTIDGFDKEGEGSRYSFNTAMQWRGQEGLAFSSVDRKTRFNNSQIISVNNDHKSWYPFLGPSLTIRVPFADGDETFYVDLDSDSFRAAMAPCVSRWKIILAERKRSFAAQQEIEKVNEIANDAMSAKPETTVGNYADELSRF